MFMIRKEDWGKVVSYRGEKGAIVDLWGVIPDRRERNCWNYRSI